MAHETISENTGWKIGIFHNSLPLNPQHIPVGMQEKNYLHSGPWSPTAIIFHHDFQFLLFFIFLPSKNSSPGVFFLIFLVKALFLHLRTSTVHLYTGKKSIYPKYSCHIYFLKFSYHKAKFPIILFGSLFISTLDLQNWQRTQRQNISSVQLIVIYFFEVLYSLPSILVIFFKNLKISLSCFK